MDTNNLNNSYYDLTDPQIFLKRQKRKRNRFTPARKRLTPVTTQITHPKQTKTTLKPYLYLVLIGLVVGFTALLHISLGGIEQIITNADNLPRQFSPALLISVTLIFFASGLVKGVGGIGMALVSVPIMSVIYSPSIAVAVVSIPLIITNVWQGLIAADPGKTFKNYYPIIITMTLTMLVTSYYSDRLSESVTSITLGIIAILFACLNLGLKIPTVSPVWDRSLQILAGITAGIAGGISGLVVIPLILYMISRKIDKEACVPALGVMFLISGVVIVFSYGLNGTMTNQLFLISCLASVPALIGVFVGEKIRHRINEVTFRRFVLYLILAIGTKIILSAAQ